jgi:hypothetical protein
MMRHRRNPTMDAISSLVDPGSRINDGITIKKTPARETRAAIDRMSSYRGSTIRVVRSQSGDRTAVSRSGGTGIPPREGTGQDGPCIHVWHGQFARITNRPAVLVKAGKARVKSVSGSPSHP